MSNLVSWSFDSASDEEEEESPPRSYHSPEPQMLESQEHRNLKQQLSLVHPIDDIIITDLPTGSKKQTRILKRFSPPASETLNPAYSAILWSFNINTALSGWPSNWFQKAQEQKTREKVLQKFAKDQPELKKIYDQDSCPQKELAILAMLMFWCSLVLVTEDYHGNYVVETHLLAKYFDQLGTSKSQELVSRPMYVLLNTDFNELVALVAYPAYDPGYLFFNDAARVVMASGVQNKQLMFSDSDTVFTGCVVLRVSQADVLFSCLEAKSTVNKKRVDLVWAAGEDGCKIAAAWIQWKFDEPTKLPAAPPAVFSSSVPMVPMILPRAEPLIFATTQPQPVRSIGNASWRTNSPVDNNNNVPPVFASVAAAKISPINDKENNSVLTSAVGKSLYKQANEPDDDFECEDDNQTMIDEPLAQPKNVPDMRQVRLLLEQEATRLKQLEEYKQIFEEHRLTEQAWRKRNVGINPVQEDELPQFIKDDQKNNAWDVELQISGGKRKYKHFRYSAATYRSELEKAKQWEQQNRPVSIESKPFEYNQPLLQTPISKSFRPASTFSNFNGNNLLAHTLSPLVLSQPQQNNNNNSIFDNNLSPSPIAKVVKKCQPVSQTSLMQQTSNQIVATRELAKPANNGIIEEKYEELYDAIMDYIIRSNRFATEIKEESIEKTKAVLEFMSLKDRSGLSELYEKFIEPNKVRRMSSQKKNKRKLMEAKNNGSWPTEKEMLAARDHCENVVDELIESGKKLRLFA